MTNDRAKLVTDLIELIIGSTTTVGETNADNKAIANLKEMEKILVYVTDVIIREYGATMDAYEASRQVSHGIAKQMLVDTQKFLDEVIQ